MNRVVADGFLAAEMKVYEEAIGPNFEEQVFFLAKANSFDNPLTTDTYPLEFSVSVFSIRGGVMDCFSTLIDHESMRQSLPSGCSHVARLAAEDFGLPIVPSQLYKQYSIGTSDSLLALLEAFMNLHYQPTDGGKRYLLAIPNDKESVENSLDCLLAIAQAKSQGDDGDAYVDTGLNDFVKSIEVLDFPKLLFRCASKVKAKKPQYDHHMIQFNLVPLAESLLNSPKYNYDVGITCKYHAQENTLGKIDMCTKNNVLRRAFLFLDEMLYGLGMEATQKHLVSRYSNVHGNKRLSRTVMMMSAGDPLSENPGQ